MYRNGSFTEVNWADVRVGEIVSVARDNFIPADLAVIFSPGEKGQFYIETKSLDGETNLKIKNVASDLVPRIR